MSEHDVVDALIALGFSLNEGRAYAALLTGGPSTGYEVGRRANVPRSAVYGVLRRLVATGAARSIPGPPERFVAVPPEELMALLRRRFDSQQENLEAALRSLDVEPQVPDAFTVHGYDRVIEEARRLVESATDRLVLSGWPRELVLFERELSAASGRGVYTVIFSHAALPDSLSGVHFSYGLAEDALEAFWKHRLVVVADDVRTLVGATEQAPDDSAVLSETAAIAEVATSRVALDITLLAQRFDQDVEHVMARMLGDRVGRLDRLMAEGTTPTLGAARGNGRAEPRRGEKAGARGRIAAGDRSGR